MPRIFDNIDLRLLPAPGETLESANRGDFCVGHSNLRGWKGLASYVHAWSGQGRECRWLLIGMQPLPQQELREALSLANNRPKDSLERSGVLKSFQGKVASLSKGRDPGAAALNRVASVRRIASGVVR